MQYFCQSLRSRVLGPRSAILPVPFTKTVLLTSGVCLGTCVASIYNSKHNTTNPIMSMLGLEAYAKHHKNNKTSHNPGPNQLLLNTNPPLAKGVHPQTNLFPTMTLPAKFYPPVPTLASDLTPEEQAAIIETTLTFGLPSIENILVRPGFTLSYNFRDKCSNWVAEHYWHSPEPFPDKANRANHNFYQDQSIPNVFRASTNDYLNSGYSRGHLAPAASHKCNEQRMHDTFALSNIIPQNSIMNEGDWAQLEKLTRHIVKHFSNVRVLTGPLYVSDWSRGYRSLPCEVLGTTGILVPTHLYKVIYLTDKQWPQTCQQNECILTPTLLLNSVRFNYPRSLYTDQKRKTKAMIEALPNGSPIKMQLMDSFDYRTKLKDMDTIPQNENGTDEIVIMAFVLENSPHSKGNMLHKYQVDLRSLESISGLLLVPRQDINSITMSPW